MACDRKEGSQFWRSLQAIKHEIHRGIICSIGDGADTLFWMDPWLDRRPLSSKFPALFAICSDLMILVADAATHGSWDIQFRRNFVPIEEVRWEEMRDSLPLSLSDTPDQVAWAISPSGSFTVRSAYRDLLKLHG